MSRPVTALFVVSSLLFARPAGADDIVSLHQDNYFLTGFSRKHQSKFQVSLKIDLYPNEGHHSVHFAYSQRSRWNVYDRSQPFAENNYAPELFYTYWHRLPRHEPGAGCSFFRARAGAQHESNGESYPESRGWNRVYASARYGCYGEGGERYVLADLRLWAPPFGTKGNPNIAEYYGYGDLTLSAGSDGTERWYDAFDLTVQARKGTRDWGTGSVEVDARWKPPIEVLRRFTPFLAAQLFHGHGETLLRYDEVVTAFRVGVGFAERSTRAR